MIVDEFEKHKSLVIKESNSTLKIAGLYSAILGILSSCMIFIFEKIGLANNLTIPGIWALIAGLYSLILYYFASKNLIKGFVIYIIFIPYISIPSILFVISYFLLPSGTATYITGPPSYLYYFLIIMTGFLFNSKIPIVAGIIAGSQYFISYLYGINYLKELSHPDKILLQDFTDPSIYFFKSLMMIFGGFIVSVFSKNTKILIHDIIEEENEKHTIDRLFGQYVSPEVKDKIISKTKESISERKKIAILFSDIRSFTTLSEKNDPDKLVHQLNEFLDKMVHCINSEKGIIDKFIGDAIMATFGGIIDLENSSYNAYNAAKLMLSQLDELNQQWAKTGFPKLQIGIGLHYGEVIMGSIGSENRKDYTVIGDTVNTTSRIESLTKKVSKDLLLSDSLYSNLPVTEKNELIDLGSVKVKGKENSIRIYSNK